MTITPGHHFQYDACLDLAAVSFLGGVQSLADFAMGNIFTHVGPRDVTSGVN